MLISCEGVSKEGDLSEEAAVRRPRLELLTPEVKVTSSVPFPARL